MVVAREPVVPAPALLHRVSWGAIFAGAVIAVALTALLGLLGLGIGLGSLDVAQGDSVEDAPKATLIWWAATSILATGIGGFVAARLAGIPRSITGALHGFAVWAVTTLLTLWLATSAVGFALGAATNVVTTTARVTSDAVTTVGGAAVSAGGAVAPSPSSSDVNSARDRAQQEAQAILDEAGVGQQSAQQAGNAIGTAARNIAMSPGTADAEINRLINRLFEGPDAALSPQEREALVTALAQRAGMSRQEAETAAQRWEAQANAAWANVRTTGEDVASEARDTAVEVTDTAADVLSKVAWGMFLISLAGLVAAVLGAAIGGATLGLGLIAAGAVAGRDDRDHDRDRVVHDHDRV
ncbi:MAG: hypothetical protein ACR2JJ_03545 [Sphingomicrobium sp.]